MDIQASYKTYTPLAERMRPNHIDEIIGQQILLVGNDENESRHKGSLRLILESGEIPSMILWGPPGTGKTSIARLISTHIKNADFISVSATSSGVKDIKKICEKAVEKKALGISTCFFIDEIHRFNKSQQDVLLHYVEEGTVILIGATTENPSFEINAALLSRVRVFILETLSADALLKIFRKAEKILSYAFDIDDIAIDMIISQADGDARRLLNIVEQLFVMQNQTGTRINKDILQDMHFYSPARYDKHGDQHYNMISALHKSIRGSDCDAALYWFARMLEGGEDPRFIARRLLRTAYEDIGLADPRASDYALHAWQAYERMGSPEGEIALASTVVYLALSPKSNAVYKAYGDSRIEAQKNQNENPPAHILNAPTTLMKNMGYGKNYQYDHNTELGFSGQDYFPESMERKSFYQPYERGFEREMQKRLEYFNKLRKDIKEKTQAKNTNRTEE